MNDLKFAFRQLLKHKVSSLLAVLLLALGIGGTTAVFSVADKVLFNPIPGRSGDRLFTLREMDVMLQFPNSKLRRARSLQRLEFGVWDLFGVWSLGFGDCLTTYAYPRSLACLPRANARRHFKARDQESVHNHQQPTTDK